MPNGLEALFPNLVGTTWEKTSDRTDDYNCFAWAGNDTEKWWSPLGSYYWPENAPRHLYLISVAAAFETLGYVRCDSGDLEQGFEKIAIYVNDLGRPTHAARQLENGQWTSKLGNLEDISHTLEALTGAPNPDINPHTPYGIVALFLKRARATT